MASEQRTAKRPMQQTPAQLQRRLEEGWDLIEAAHARGEDVRALEAHWVKLLHQYELLCQQEAS